MARSQPNRLRHCPHRRTANYQCAARPTASAEGSSHCQRTCFSRYIGALRVPAKMTNGLPNGASGAAQITASGTTHKLGHDGFTPWPELRINARSSHPRAPYPPPTFALPCSLARLIGKVSKQSQSVDFSGWKVEGRIKELEPRFVYLLILPALTGNPVCFCGFFRVPFGCYWLPEA